MEIKCKKNKIDRSHYLFDRKALIALIIPLIIEQLLAVLVGMADSVMIASVGESAVAGVSLVDQIMILFIALFSALATGGAVVAGQYLGMRNEKNANKAATQLVWFITIVAVGIMVLMYIGKEFILRVIFGNISPDVYDHANTYLLIVAASVPFLAMYNGGAAIFRAMGNSKLSMRVSILMNAINVIGNAILIYGFHCGTEGVAIPTLISRVIAGTMIVAFLCKDKYQLHMEKTLRYRPNGGMIKRILSIGIPNGLENSMFQIGKILVLSLVSGMGTYAITSNAVTNIIAQFQILPGMAIGLAVTAVISRCIGAGDYEQVKYYTRKLLLITYVAMWTTNLIIFIALPFILHIYHLSDITAKTTEQLVLFHSISCIIIWPLAFTLPGTLRAAGDAKFTMYVSIISMWTCRIGFSYLLGAYLGWGVLGIWVAMVLDWCVRVPCFIWRYVKGRWKGKAVV